jgi:hypothetical protein
LGNKTTNTSIQIIHVSQEYLGKLKIYAYPTIFEIFVAKYLGQAKDSLISDADVLMASKGKNKIIGHII